MFGIPNAWRMWTRIVVPVEKNWHPTNGPRPRGAKAVIDESTAPRLSAVVGDGEFSEFAGVAAHGAPEGSATTTAALIRRNTPAAAIAVATLACLWVGNRMNQSLPDTVAHAGADGGSFGEPTAAAGPMFGAGRDPGARGGDPAMNLKNSARVAVLAVTAAVTANGALAGDAVQWRVADGGNGHWYGISASATTWATASASARSAGAWLADIEADQEGVFIASLWAMFGLTDGAWAGGYQANESCGPNCGWAWSSGEAWGYTNWNANEPNDFSGPESRLELSPVNSLAEWFDAPDSPSYLRRAVIEWSADCNSDGIVDYGQCRDGTLPDYNGNNIPDCCERSEACVVGSYPLQWRVADGGNGHWYQIDATSMTWEVARDRASSQSGYLATITNGSEQRFLSTLDWSIITQWGVWLGARRQSCTWQWVNGESWGYDNWAPNEPSGGCFDAFLLLYVQLGTNNELRWDDCICPPDGTPTGSLIEWSADCNNDNIVDFGQILNGTLPDTNTNGIPDCCEPGNKCCLGDIYENHIIDGGDLGVLLSEWGVVTPTTRSDLNRDGFVDGADLGRLLGNWGPCGG